MINCAGLLTGNDASFRAVCAAMSEGAKIILISAIGTEADTILRPGLALADGRYGGSSLARARAALPLITPVVGDGAQNFNPIHAADLAMLVVETLHIPAREPIEVGGPQTVTQTTMLTNFRQWLGQRPAHGMGRIGDALRLAPISATFPCSNWNKA